MENQYAIVNDDIADELELLGFDTKYNKPLGKYSFGAGSTSVYWDGEAIANVMVDQRNRGPVKVFIEFHSPDLRNSSVQMGPSEVVAKKVAARFQKLLGEFKRPARKSLDDLAQEAASLSASLVEASYELGRDSLRTGRRIDVHNKIHSLKKQWENVLAEAVEIGENE